MFARQFQACGRVGSQAIASRERGDGVKKACLALNLELYLVPNFRDEETMDTIYADYSISMSEFKKNPAQVLREAGEQPVAVLNHNRPAFYMVAPRLFEALVEELIDKDLTELTRKRLRERDSAIEVDVDQI